MKKCLIPLLLILAVCLLTGCGSKTEAEMAPSASPMASMLPADLPDASMTTPGAGMVGQTVNTMVGVTTAAKARDAVEKIEEELVRLSEVDEAQVIVAGTTAVVALDFDAQYQSGVTDRVEKMVKERIQSVVSGVENVIVTDDAAIAQALKKLGDRLDGEADMTELEGELRKLISSMNNMA